MVPTFIPGLFFNDNGPNVDNEILAILNDAEEKILHLLKSREMSFHLGAASSAAVAIAEELSKIAKSKDGLSDELQDHFAMLSAIGMVGVFVHDIFDAEEDCIFNPEDN